MAISRDWVGDPQTSNFITSEKKIVPGIHQQIQSLQLVGGNTCHALQMAIASSFSSSSSLAVKANLLLAKSVIFKPYKS